MTDLYVCITLFRLLVTELYAYKEHEQYHPFLWKTRVEEVQVISSDVGMQYLYSHINHDLSGISMSDKQLRLWSIHMQSTSPLQSHSYSKYTVYYVNSTYISVSVACTVSLITLQISACILRGKSLRFKVNLLQRSHKIQFSLLAV